MREDDKLFLCETMQKYLDDTFFKSGFNRKKNSLLYIKRILEGTLKVDIHFSYHPSYYCGAIMHIYPYMYIRFPKIIKYVQILKEQGILGDFWRGAGTEDFLGQPIQIGISSKDWVVYDASDMVEVIKSVDDFVNTHTLPLLNEINSLDDLLNLYKRRDDRIIWFEHTIIYIICAYIYIKDFTYAKSVFETEFKQLGPRNRYSALYEYLEINIKK